MLVGPSVAPSLPSAVLVAWEVGWSSSSCWDHRPGRHHLYHAFYPGLGHCPRPAYATATTCAGTAAATRSSSSPTATTTGRWLPPWFASAGATYTISGFSAHSGPIR